MAKGRQVQVGTAPAQGVRSGVSVWEDSTASVGHGFYTREQLAEHIRLCTVALGMLPPEACPSCGGTRGERAYAPGATGQPVTCGSGWHDDEARGPGDPGPAGSEGGRHMTNRVTPGRAAYDAHRQVYDGSAAWDRLEPSERREWEAIAAAARAVPEPAPVPRLNDRSELTALADGLKLRPDWHEPDNREVNAVLHPGDFDNAGFWGTDEAGEPVTYGEGQCEAWVELEHDGLPVAQVNLATLFAWAAEKREES
jgi:hypothetical protein